MAEVLVLVEHDDGTPKKVTARAADPRPHARRADRGLPRRRRHVRRGPRAIAEYGAEKVYVGESDDFDGLPRRPEGRGARSAGEPRSRRRAVLVASTPRRKEVAARVAVKTGGGFCWPTPSASPPTARRRRSVFGGGDDRQVQGAEPARRSSRCAPNSHRPGRGSAGAAAVEKIAVERHRRGQGARRSLDQRRRGQGRSPGPHRGADRRLRWSWSRVGRELLDRRGAGRLARCRRRRLARRDRRRLVPPPEPGRPDR